MTSFTPTNNFPPVSGIDDTLSFLFTFVHSNPLHADVLVGGTKQLCFRALDAFQKLIPIPTGSHRDTGRATPDEPLDLEIRRVHSHQAGTMDRVPENMPSHALSSHSNTFIIDADDLESGGQPVAEDASSIRALTRLSKRAPMWVALLIVVVLSLVVVPGLVLGIVTKQLPWGIALCGLIATLISFVASVYYHLDK